MATMNLTKLNAVNRILRAAREHPVSSLGEGGESDSLLAEQLLDERLMQEQMIGLHVNTVDAEFTPDEDDNYRVVLPDNTMQVQGWNLHANRNFFHREDDGVVRLYDGDKVPASDSFEDDSTVSVKITYGLQFEELPVHHRFSIADQAAVEYQMAVLGSTTLDNHLKGIAGRSRAIARAHDMRSRPHNQFNDGRAQGPRTATRYVQRSWPYNDQVKEAD